MDAAEEKTLSLRIQQQKPLKLKIKEKKRLGKKNKISKYCWDNYKSCNIHIMGIPDREEKEENDRRNIRNNNDQEFPQLNVRH